MPTVAVLVVHTVTRFYACHMRSGPDSQRHRNCLKDVLYVN